MLKQGIGIEWRTFLCLNLTLEWIKTLMRLFSFEWISPLWHTQNRNFPFKYDEPIKMWCAKTFYFHFIDKLLTMCLAFFTIALSLSLFLVFPKHRWATNFQTSFSRIACCSSWLCNLEARMSFYVVDMKVG